jgi:hypothetical protein
MLVLKEESAPDHAGCYRCRAPRLYGKLNTNDPLLPYRHHHRQTDKYCCRNDYFPLLAKAIDMLPYLPRQCLEHIGAPIVDWQHFTEDDAQLLVHWLCKPVLQNGETLVLDISNLHLLVLFRFFINGHPRYVIHDADHLVAARGTRRCDFQGEISFMPTDSVAASNLRRTIEALYKKYGLKIHFHRPLPTNVSTTQSQSQAPPSSSPSAPHMMATEPDAEQQGATASSAPHIPTSTTTSAGAGDIPSPRTQATLDEFAQHMRGRNSGKKSSRPSQSVNARNPSRPLQDKRINVEEPAPSQEGPPPKRQKTTGTTPAPERHASQAQPSPVPAAANPSTPIVIHYNFHLHGSEATEFLQRSFSSPLDFLGLSSQIHTPLTRTASPNTSRAFRVPETPGSPLADSSRQERVPSVRRGQSSQSSR